MTFICHLTFIRAQLATNTNFQNLEHLVNFRQVGNRNVLLHQLLAEQTYPLIFSL